MAFIVSSAGERSRPGVAGDALLAAGATLAMLAFHAARGFPTLADSGGDNDSVLRLVQVRDLLAGQGWFDPFQYRMGLDGGFAMHWSRLVDLPIALLVALFGEGAALVIWPALLFCLCLFLILRAARAIAGPQAILPSVVVGGLALYFVNVFPPGALDHHNVQLALALAALASLLGGRAPAVAGVCTALMLAVGMEAAPYAAVACGLAALLFLFGGDRKVASGFGTGFAATCLAALAATVPVRDWLVSQCDAFSFPQAALGILGGASLAVVASAPALRDRFPRRLVALGLVAIPCAALALAAFPQCLADPYAGLDPRLRAFWLNAVTEAQSFPAILRSEPTRLAVFYATPLVALAVVAWTIIRHGIDRDRAVIAAFLGAAVLVSLWQVRGSTFAIPIAAIPLAAMIAAARSRAEAAPTAGAQAAMVLAWLVSVNLVWQLAASPFRPAQEEASSDAAKAAACYAHADYAALAALPQGTVAAVSNLGSSILANTPHRVLAGPYHRNQQGNLANLDIWMSEPATSRAHLAALGVDYLTLCHGNDETGAIAGWAPEGLLARLAAGEAPAWLAPETTEQALAVWRVLPSRQ